MIWATVSSWSCFCWLYRASTSLAAKNIINLISVSTIWWYPCVESSLVLLEEGVCYDQCILLAELIILCPASFCTPRPNLPVTPGVSWLPTFAFQSPIMKRTSFLVLLLEGLVGLQKTVQLQLLQRYWSGHRLGLPWQWMDCLGYEQRSYCHFWDVQAGFRKGRGTRDQIANIHWIIEKAREFQKNIYFCLIDYAKAFDCVDHNKLWNILKEMGIPDLPLEKPVCRSGSNS